MATRSTEERTIDFANIDGEIGLVVKTNGGSLTITTVPDGDTVATITTDGGKTISARGQKLKFTPAGGCAYTI